MLYASGLILLSTFVAGDLTVHVRQQEGLVLRATGPKTRSVEDAYAHASAKYNVVPSLEEHKLAARGLRLPSTSFAGDFGYTVNLNFASQGSKAFPLLVDTGSSLTWVNAANGQTKDSRGLSLYDPTHVRRISNKLAKITYLGGGGVQGNVYQDTLRFGSASAPVEITAVMTSSNHGGLQTSGLLALSINPTASLPDSSGITRFHANLVKAGISNGVFSVDFRADPAGRANGDGELVFAPNVGKYGPVTWVPVWGPGYDWLIPSSQIRINQRVIRRPWPNSVPDNLSFDKRDQVYRDLVAGVYEDQQEQLAKRNRDPPCIWLDTGTTLNLIDDATLLAIVSQLPGAKSDGGGMYSVPCQKPSNAPDTIWWEMGGHWFPLYYKVGSLLWYNKGNGYCPLTLTSRGGSNGCDVFGAFFFHGVYTVFDDKNKRVGLAIKK